jgi:hypothetical protein
MMVAVSIAISQGIFFRKVNISAQGVAGRYVLLLDSKYYFFFFRTNLNFIHLK